MRNLILTALFLIPGLASAEWKLNPYTQRMDYYESKAAVVLSTGALQAEINALHVTTATLTQDLATEVSRATVRENAIGASTGTLKTQIDAVAVSTGVNASAISALSASTTTLGGRIAANEAWISTAQPRLDNLDAYALSTGTAFGGDVSGTYDDITIVSVPPAAVDLSTVTANHVLKAGDTMTGNLSLPGLTATYGVSAATGVFTTLYGDGSNLTGLATDGELAAVAVSTGVNATDISAIKLSTAPLANASNWDTAYGWGDHSGLYLSAPATFYVVQPSDYLVAPASFTYVASETDPLSVKKTGDTMTGNLTFNNGGTTLHTYGYIDSTQRYDLSTGQTGIGGAALTLYDWNPSARVLLSAYPTEHGHNRIGHALSLGKITAPTHTLDVSGGGVFSSSVTASAFYGAGTGLTAVLSSQLSGTVPTALVDLSTVTTALAGKLTSPATFYIVKTSDYLQAPATFQYQAPLTAGVDYLAPDGDGSSLTGVIQSTATGTYALRVATATYLATAPGACGAGEFINSLTADGTKTCATPAGGGDVVLAATQTFTGANTFTGSVTVSSFTAISTATFTQGYKITCPTGFTSMEAAGRQLGCIQTDLQSTAALCYVAANTCFTTYGGTLPPYPIRYAAGANYALTNATTYEEWTGEAGYSSSANVCGIIRTTTFSGALYNEGTTTAAYRCWIPR